MTLDEVSPSKVWAVGAMGSCRVHTPLTLAAKAGLIDFAWEGAYGFRHNPLELLQGLGILRGTVKAPPELTDLLNLVKPSAFGETDRYKLRFSNVEAMIVEVSSIRVIEVDGWQLQLNRFREALVKGGVAVILVGTVNYGYDGSWIAQRVGLTAALAQVAATEPDTFFFDPAQLTGRYTLREVMKDLGHYAPAFEPTVGAELAQFFVRSLSGYAATTMLY